MNDFNNLSDIGNPANLSSPFNPTNIYDSKNQFDAMNIANRHPEYIGTGILALKDSSTDDISYVDSKNKRINNSKGFWFIISLILLLIIIGIL